MRSASLALALLLLAFGLAPAGAVAADVGAFNPYAGHRLPNSHDPKGENAEVLKAIGGARQSIEADGAYRPHWREEVYPIVFGSRSSPNEVIAVLDFAKPESERVWKAVRAAATKSRGRARVVLFGLNSELYGMDLTGLAIWACMNRPDQAGDYVSWALSRWNEIKAFQRKTGRVRPFRDEYDGVTSKKDYPMLFTGLARLTPSVPEREQHAISLYAYEAGNMNMFQASEVCKFYRLQAVPSVIVNGRALSQVSESAILSALR